MKPCLPLCWNSCHYIRELSCKHNSRAPAVLMISALVRSNNSSAIDHCCVFLWGFPEHVLSFLSFVVVPNLPCWEPLKFREKKTKMPRCEGRAKGWAVAWAPALLTSCVILGKLLGFSVSHCSHLQSVDDSSIFLLGCCEELTRWYVWRVWRHA